MTDPVPPSTRPAAGRLLPVTAALAVAAASLPTGVARGQGPPAPPADHHAHLSSRGSAELLSQIRVAIGQADSLPEPDPWTAAELLARLDSAGIEKAAVLSVAYFWAMPEAGVEEERARLEEENDWVAARVRDHPERFVGFCSVNPLADWAPEEVGRCGAKPEMTGLKLHFANSDVDLRDPEDVDRVRAVFAAAAGRGLPIVVHMRTRRPDYGRRDAEIFIRDVLPAAEGVPVQVAHMAGWGGYDPATDAALAAFAGALASGELDGGKLYFDVSGVVRPVPEEAAAAGRPGWWPGDRYRRLARRIREVGPARVLFGSDWAAMSPPGYLASLREELRPHLSAEGWRALLGAAAPWME